MRRANVVKTCLLQAYREKNRKLYEKENKLLLLLLLYVTKKDLKGWAKCDHCLTLHKSVNQSIILSAKTAE